MKFAKHIAAVCGCLFLTLLITLLGGCAGCAKAISPENPVIDPGKYIVSKVGEPTGTRLVGLGVELDPHFFSQNVTRNEGARPADWERIVVPRIRKMQVQRFRVMIMPQWWEPRNDNDDPAVADLSKFTFESAEMQSLCKVLDLAQAEDINVTLVLWGCQINCRLLDPAYSDVHRHFLCAPDAKNWVVEPASHEEFAENFSTVVKYLIQTKGYTCIKEITPFNEPDGNVIELARYIPLVKTLDARFKADGIRSEVRFNLSDNTDTRRFFLEGCARELSAEADLFNSHTYIFGYDTPNSEILKWERLNVAAAKKAGKRHLVGEFGSNQCVGATRQTDIDRYERGVLMSRLALNFLNAGAAGISYWSLLDQYYGFEAGYDEMQQLGLWKLTKQAYAVDPNPDRYHSIREDYEVRPQYYAYSLLTRFLRRGAEVFPIDMHDELIAASAFRDGDDRWVYVVANGNDRTKDIAIVNPHAMSTSHHDYYVYAKDRLPEGDRMIVPTQQITSYNHTLYLRIAPQSVVLLVRK